MDVSRGKIRCFVRKSVEIIEEPGSTTRRLESARPNQLLTNEIKHFLKSLVFYSDARPMPWNFPGHDKSEKLHHTAFVEEFRFA